MATKVVVRRSMLTILGVPLVAAAVWLPLASGDASKDVALDKAKFEGVVKPLVSKYCLSCHSTKAKKGGLDLERFAGIEDVRKDVKPWQLMIEQIEAEEMPPKGKPQPTEAEKKHLLTWLRAFLDAEARARTGDPGHVPLRRLSNAEYDATIRDLTGVDLRPTREFPADGAAGEGFTNAAESLSDISPSLLSRYLDAAKGIAEHAVLLPDGFRFSPSKTRRDWTDEGTARLRKFYASLVGGEGKLDVQPYLLATVRHHDALDAGKFEEVAAKEKVNAKYLRVLWQTLNGDGASGPLGQIRTKWRLATEKDVATLVADIDAWRSALWKTVKVGNYIQASWTGPPGSAYTESLSRQAAFDPPASASAPLRVALKPAPGQPEVRLFLAARETGSAGPIVWQRPRFEAAGKQTLLLRDYADFGPSFEADLPSAFVGTAKYLTAIAEQADDSKVSLEELAKRHGVDAAFLRQWAKLIAIEPRRPSTATTKHAVAHLTLLDERTAPNNQHPSILGWRKKGTDLPVVVANSSDEIARIPGRVSPRTVGVHPTPQEFVAIVWRSLIEGAAQVAIRVHHAHPACGNGVGWRLEHRGSDGGVVLGEGTLDLGKDVKFTKPIKLREGELIVLVVEPRDANHLCDMTEVWMTVTEERKGGGVWDLAKDVTANIQADNPHADKHGNATVWAFARGPAKNSGVAAGGVVPPESILGRWRAAVVGSEKRAAVEKLAKEVEAILAGSPPANEKDANRILYDRLVSPESPLFAGVDVTKLAKPRVKGVAFGLAKERFAKPDGDSLIAASDQVVEIRLPAAVFAGREFVVDAQLQGEAGPRLVHVRAATTAPGAGVRWDGPVLASPDSAAYKRLVEGNAEFRTVFPLFLCFPQVVPTDEVVTLKMFHREDEPLIRLFLSDEQIRQLDRLWSEQRFVSRQPASEHDYLPQFMGYTTQDTPKAFQQFFIDRKPLFQKQAEEFVKLEEAAIPRHLDALVDFAEKAYRRPLQDKEKTDLRALYGVIRKKGAPHDEAFRGVLSRVLVSPAFLFRIEAAPKGKAPVLVSDWEIATRLSYFLWSSLPDDELRKEAAAGRLRDPAVLAAQTRRMLKDPRTRSLAIEFGTQWIHVRGIDQLKEKNEKLFPTFDAKLREAIYEESILFFQDLFQSDRSVNDILDADYTFLNETLAKHYGIPGVAGPEWRRVEGVRKHGRGGILGLASVHAKQSGASRTSPVLRGNWVVETLLGEKLPRPPANVPALADVEGTDKLSTRQMVEQHASNPSCAACHVRIDPYGFAFENFDAIGRWRAKESSGHAVDTKAKLKDGTQFEGIDGLRGYLLTKKRDVIVRLFCQKLLGYALGRVTTLSDTTLIDEMVSELKKNDGRMSAAVLTIVRSPQFRMIRGSEFGE